MLYDITGFVGSIGGTLGLFIGFSFRDVIDMVLNNLKKLSHTTVKQNKKQQQHIQNGNTCKESSAWQTYELD